MNRPKTIAMLLTNPFRPDPRVHKEAVSLIKSGYKVFLICWDRLQEYPEEQNFDQINLIRIHVKSKYSAGSHQILYLFIFLIKVIRQLNKIKPDIVHCHDLDTTLAGAFYSKLHHVPWIFDAHECYPEQIGPQVNRLIYKLLIILERKMAVKTNQVITVGKSLADHFRTLGAEVTIIGNYPLCEAYIDQKKADLRKALSIPSTSLVISYIGGFTLARAIVPFLEGANQYKDVIILLAGDGPQRKQIEEMIVDHPNIIYLGWINQNLIPSYYSISDIIYYGLKIDDGNSQFSVPNTLFSAMAAGIPLITTDVGEISMIVREENCGVVIPMATPEYIAEGIIELTDNDYRKQLGVNGKKAFQNKYNWEIAQKLLLELYSSILLN